MTSTVVRQKVLSLGWWVFMHPPSSSDLTSSDYYLFLYMANDFANEELASIEAREIWFVSISFKNNGLIFYRYRFTAYFSFWVVSFLRWQRDMFSKNSFNWSMHQSFFKYLNKHSHMYIYVCEQVYYMRLSECGSTVSRQSKWNYYYFWLVYAIECGLNALIRTYICAYFFKIYF